MTAVALPTPRLVGADLLKLRKNHGLSIVTALLTVGAAGITIAIMVILHLANPAKHGAAGGITNLGHVSSLIGLLGVAAAAIVGSRVGAGDKDAGIYRDLVVTGRSRTSLYLSRIPAGAAYLLPFVAAAYAVAGISAVVLAGSNPTPDARLLVLQGLWTLLSVGFFYVLSVAVAALLGSRSYAIGVILAFRLAIGPLVASISALGIVRELMPNVAIQRLLPSAVGDSARMGPYIGMSTGAIAAVLAAWAVVAVVAAALRDVSRDA
jgi:ABC-type transport system involved in multi-copper enzyme maturation permease subunit